MNQKAELIEPTDEYAVSDQRGATLGSVAQVGRSALRRSPTRCSAWSWRPR
ncbi:hypothetical protein ACIRPK_09585 [Kitasatospora sp. NPDC101801]|uniref:hypothetical protein n=1 Tax=Kitasatospora sp. NPDC101801 TaxID=3364103 RepID=UPI0037F7580D